MIVFPGSKINLGLRVISRRDDGYHDIETVFCPVDLTDILEVVVSPGPRDEMTVTGISLPGKPEDNLCRKALDTLRSIYTLPPFRIHLHKAVPPGSGLGGGSADAAAMLKAVDRLAGLGLSREELMKLAGRLGADCAFFIRKRPALATGRGDDFVDIKLPTGLGVIIVIPPLQVSTAWAYSLIQPAGGKGIGLARADLSSITKWKDVLVNDFEEPLFRHYPEIGQIKDELYRMGADYASMSGSGSAVFGIFRELPEVSAVFPGCMVYSEKLES